MQAHDWVRDAVPFGFTSNAWREEAETTWRLRRGYSLTKSQLLVALWRALGLPARLRVVSLAPGLLRGLAGLELPLDHAFAECWLEGAWRRVDSHVVDLPLWLGATARLKAEGQFWGLGVSLGGQPQWRGPHDAYVQCPGGPGGGSWLLKDHGPFEDAWDFYRSVPEAHQGGLFPTWFASPVVGCGMASRLEALRRQGEALRALA